MKQQTKSYSLAYILFIYFFIHSAWFLIIICVVITWRHPVWWISINDSQLSDSDMFSSGLLHISEPGVAVNVQQIQQYSDGCERIIEYQLCSVNYTYRLQ